MITNSLLFVLFFFILIKSAGHAIRYSSKLAKLIRLPEFIISFFLIALISVIPETIISIISAYNGHPELALGTLLGSNVTDLTLVFGIVALLSSNGIKVKSKILSENFYYLILLLFPLILGFDGTLSRIDGGILVGLGILFFIKSFRDTRKLHKDTNYSNKEPLIKNLFLLFVSLIVILISAYYSVGFAVKFAEDLNVPIVLIGLTVVAIGTCLPELVFSIKAVKKNRDSLALGDILGTVITDATIILGIVALISPFSYNPINVYFTASAMFIAGFVVTKFMKSEKVINKKEGILLILFYIAFVSIEFIINKY